jgi:hypothetical protein
MVNWIASVIEDAQSRKFTGRLHMPHRYGRVQYIERAQMPVTPSETNSKELPEVLRCWAEHKTSGYVDVFLICGVVADIVESETIFPPKAWMCPVCGGQVERDGDYGNTIACVRRGCWRGLESELRPYRNKERQTQ